MKKTPFETLDLPADASLEQLRLRWRQLAAIHHPDVGGELASFLLYKSAYERALKQISQRPCLACDGAGQVAKHRRGSIKPLWETCEKCEGSGKSKNH